LQAQATQGEDLALAAGGIAAAADRCRARADTHAFVGYPAVAPGGRFAYALKDMVDVTGHAPSFGLAPAPGPVASRTAPVVAQLEAAGGRLVAFTEMTPLAFDPSGANRWRPRPLNPFDPGRICGGSSSGSAVAVACGAVDLALGSDTAGSLRIPAQCCGVSSWKPSPDLVPRTGTLPLAPSLDTLGFLARDAAWLDLAAAIFAPAAEDFGRRIAVAHDLIAASDAEVAEVFRAALPVLAAAGLDLSDAALAPLVAATDAPVLGLLLGESARALAHLPQAEEDPLFRARFAKGRAMSAGDLAGFRHDLAAVRPAALALLADCAAVLLPVMPGTTPTLVACDPAEPGFSGRTLYRLSAFTRLANGLGLPVVTLPLGCDAAGLPVAGQLMGRPGSDRALIALARFIQAQTNWHRVRPDAFFKESFA